MKRLRNDGFTIIELLIATVVFSIVLLTISGAIIQIGRIYFKGVTEARTQEAARSVLADITQDLQMTSGQVTLTGLDNSTAGSQGFCIDTTRFSYVLGQQRAGDNHALVADTIPAGCLSSKAQDITGATPAGTELLGDNMRLAKLSIEQQLPNHPTMYKVTARIVYGDDDLLCVAALNNCSSDTTMSSSQIAAARDLRCKDIRSGTQFCAVSELSTMVERRLKAQ